MEKISGIYCILNTVNQKRRDAIELLCEELGMNKDSIKRSRKSGKKASLPTRL